MKISVIIGGEYTFTQLSQVSQILFFVNKVTHFLRTVLYALNYPRKIPPSVKFQFGL